MVSVVGIERLGEIKIKGINTNRFTNIEKEVDVICLFEKVRNKVMYHIVLPSIGEVSECEFGMLESKAEYGWLLQELNPKKSDKLFIRSEEMKKVYDEYNNKYKNLNEEFEVWFEDKNKRKMFEE